MTDVTVTCEYCGLEHECVGPASPVRDPSPPEPDVIEALKQADRALNNLIDEEGHRGESRLRKHPAPCNKLDFCVMNDSRQVQGRIRNALRISVRGSRPALAGSPELLEALYKIGRIADDPGFAHYSAAARVQDMKRVAANAVRAALSGDQGAKP